MLRFSTDDLPPALRDEAWREATAPFFDARPVHRDEGLSGYVAALPMAGFMIGATGFNAQQYERDRRRISVHGLDQWLVQVFLDGGLDAEHAGGRFSVRQGDVCVFDLTQPFRSEVSAGRTVSVLLPRAMIDPRSAPRHGAVWRGSQAGTRLLAQHLTALVREASHLEPEDAQAAAQATLALFGGLLRHTSQDRGVSDARLGARVRRYIAEHLSEPELDAKHLQCAFGLSRATLYRLFASEGGVAAYVRHARLDACLREIAMNPRRVQLTELLYRWGFSSDQQFTRAFQRRFGVLPSAWRQFALSGQALPAGLTGVHRHFEGLAQRVVAHGAETPS